MRNTEMIERVEMTRAVTLKGEHELVVSVHRSKGGVCLGQDNYRISESHPSYEFIRSWVRLICAVGFSVNTRPALFAEVWTWMAVEAANDPPVRAEMSRVWEEFPYFSRPVGPVAE